MKNKTYALQFRRKRTGKTDYRKRLKLLISHKPRIILRKTLRNFIAQIAEYDISGDKIVIGASSKELMKHGWNYGRSNLGAAYLTGFLLGRKAKAAGITEAIPDIGLHASKKGARVYAALKGVFDAGIKIPFSEEIMPSEERIEGKHIEEYAKILKNDNERYKRQFSDYIKIGLIPERISEEFKKVKENLTNFEAGRKQNFSEPQRKKTLRRENG